MRVGSLFWARIIGDPKGEPRPCVVTCAPPYSSVVVEVVYGRGAPHGKHQYPVEQSSQLGRLLGLTKRTFFCARAEVYLSAIDKQCEGSCPPLDLLAIQEIAEDQRLD
jgi:hypothetical protein